MEFLPNADWRFIVPYMRKAAYMFGWDWGPKLTTSGIGRPVLLKAWDNARINSIQILQDSIAKTKAFVSANILLLNLYQLSAGL